jgi:hypothetical protein
VTLGNARDFVPLDFEQTLERLTSWEGREVRVVSYAHESGRSQSHTQTVMQGVLGRLQMVDNIIDATQTASRRSPSGRSSPTASISASSTFAHAQPLPGAEAIRIDYPGYAIQVDRLA